MCLLLLPGAKPRNCFPPLLQGWLEERIKRLNAIAQQEPELWKQAFALIKTKQTKTYDEAVKLLTELRELAQHLGRPEEYESRLSQIQQEFSSLSGLKSRLRRAELIKKKMGECKAPTEKCFKTTINIDIKLQLA